MRSPLLLLPTPSNRNRSPTSLASISTLSPQLSPNRTHHLSDQHQLQSHSSDLGKAEPSIYS